MRKLYLIIPIILLMYLSCEDKKEEDTTPPTVSISSPVSGQTVNEIVTITVTTQDNEGIRQVEFFIDDSYVLTDTESPYEYEWNTTQYEDNSEHIVKVISYDNSDNLTVSQPILLIVDNSSSVPTPVVLNSINYQNGSFYISWSTNNDDDFHSYTLYESITEGMNGKTEVFTTGDNTNTSYTVTGFTDYVVRFYQVVVEDGFGLQSTSDVVVGDYLVELWGTSYSSYYTTYLNLGGIGFSGQIPPEIGDLVNLTELSFYNNELTGEIPPEIGNLVKLTKLRISENEITGSIPPEIGNLVNLERLYLSNTQLTDIPPEIGNLTNLEYIYFNETQLTGSIPIEICNLTNLTYLNLSGNQLTGSIPPEIGNLTNLTYLNLGSNELTGSIPPEIGNLTNLTTLSLHYNHLTGSIPPEIGNLTNLTWLDLGGNELTSSIPPEIGNLTNLVLLRLQNNQLTGEIPESICDLNIDWSSNSRFNITNNQLCPPYPSCVEDYVGEQDTSGCN